MHTVTASVPTTMLSQKAAAALTPGQELHTLSINTPGGTWVTCCHLSLGLASYGKAGQKQPKLLSWNNSADDRLALKCLKRYQQCFHCEEQKECLIGPFRVG
jgi:hypothetical protein